MSVYKDFNKSQKVKKSQFFEKVFEQFSIIEKGGNWEGKMAAKTTRLIITNKPLNVTVANNSYC